MMDLIVRQAGDQDLGSLFLIITMNEEENVKQLALLEDHPELIDEWVEYGEYITWIDFINKKQEEFKDTIYKPNNEIEGRRESSNK